MPRFAPARFDVLAEYAREVVGLLPRGRILVGIDGLDGAGKTTFARDLAEALRDAGTHAAVVSMDAFHEPKAVREQQPNDAATWYVHAYDYPTFRSRVIEPFRRGEVVPLEYRSRVDDSLLVDPPTCVPGEYVVLIVEGVYLHRAGLRDLWHTSVWLDVPVEVALARYAVRDGTDLDPEAAINRKYLGAQARYLHEVDPRQQADAIFDLTDAEHPRRVFADAC